MARDIGTNPSPRRTSAHEFQTLWIKNYAFFLRYAASLARCDTADAEDILSAATLKVFAYLEKTEAVTNFKALMCLAIRQVYFDQLRRQKQMGHWETCSSDAEEAAITVADTRPGVEERMIARERLRDVVSRVSEMPGIYHEVMEMRFFREMTVVEVASASGLTEVNTRKKISVIRQRLTKSRKRNSRISRNVRHVSPSGASRH